MSSTFWSPKKALEGRAGPARVFRACMSRWACLPLGFKGVVVIAVPLSALLVAGLLSYQLNRQHAEAARWLEHTHEVRAEVQEVSTLMSEAVTGVRGFLLTQRDDFLAPYHHALGALPGALERLNALVSDNPEQSGRAGRVSELTYGQLAMLGELRFETVERRRLSTLNTATLPEHAQTGLIASKRELDTLRGTLHAMTATEDGLLQERSVRLERLERWQQRTFYANIFVGIVGGLVAAYLFVAGITRRVTYLEKNAERLARGLALLPPMSTGDALGRLNHALDSTGALLREQANDLRESEARLRNVITTAPVALHVVSADGTFLFSEGKGLAALGLSSGELVGKSLFEVYRGVPEVLENHRRAVEGESFSSRVEYAGLAFDLRYAPVFEYGQVTQTTVVVNDVTEKRRAERALLRYQRQLEQQNRELGRANRAKDTFLANMSHELRTPLTAILGFSDLLKDEYFGALNTKQGEYVGTILDAGEHLLSLINDLLDLSKIEAGAMHLQPSPIDLVLTVTEALALTEGQAQKKALQLELQLPAPIAPVSADARKVKQILYNLLSNAVKFTPAQGRIQLCVSDARSGDGESEVRVEIHDSGPGISPEDQLRLFRPFTQLGSSVTQLVEGTGLGLALSKQLVELHGGRVWLRSEVGHGSTFGFSLPRRPPPPQVDKQVDNETSAELKTKG